MADTEETLPTKSPDPNPRLGLEWQTANDLLKPFGGVAANFTEAIRLLATAHIEGSDLPPGGAHHIVRLLKNDTLKAVYYFFAKQFSPEILAGKTGITPRELLEAFKPIDHAALIALCYLFKNLSAKVDKEDWDYVQTPLYEALAIGAQIGKTVPQVGIGLGLISRGLRYLAFAPLIKENRKAFKEYRQHLKSKDIPFDLEFERKMWQCSTVELSGLLIELMGFPRAVAIQFVGAVERSLFPSPDVSFGIPLRLAECLMDAYMEGHEIPTTTPTWVGQEIALSAETRGNLLSSLKEVTKEGARVEWLNKSGSNLNSVDTPEIASDVSHELDSSEQLQ